MSVTSSKPIFTFKGLSYLYHIDQCRLSPVGYDREGTKYFEIIDLVENKQIFTAEIAELDEDLVLKDKYGIIRFCVHGWQDMGQLDVYVNIKKPIGIVKDGVIYDHKRKPVYLSQQTNKGAFGCFGPPTFKLSSATNGEELGWVTPEPASIHARFDQFQDEGPKATIIAYMLQLALAKYQMLNLNLQKVKYVYKDRAKAKARKESERKKTLPVSDIPMVMAPQAPPMPPPPQVIVLSQAGTSVPAGPAAELEEIRRRSLEQEMRRASQEKERASQPQILLVKVPPKQPTPQIQMDLPPPAITELAVSDHKGTETKMPRVESSKKSKTGDEIPKPPPPPVIDGMEATLIRVKKKVRKNKSKKDEAEEEASPVMEVKADRDDVVDIAPLPSSTKPQAGRGPGNSALTGIKVLQSHTTPSYLWNEDYSGRLAPSADSKQRMLRNDPFTPVELPQRSPVKLIEDGREKKKRQSSPKQSEGTGSRASMVQKAASKNSKRSSGSSKGGTKSSQASMKQGAGDATSTARSSASGMPTPARTSAIPPSTTGRPTPAPTSAIPPSTKGRPTPAPTSAIPPSSTGRPTPAHTSAIPPSTMGRPTPAPTTPATTTPGPSAMSNPKRGSNYSSESDPTIIETDSSYRNMQSRNRPATITPAPRPATQTPRPPTETPRTTNATPLSGKMMRGSVIGGDNGGVRVIQSHASFAPSESTTHRKTSLCHATCEKRGSEVAAHAERRASVARRLSHMDPDSGMVQVLMNKPETPKPPSQAAGSRASSNRTVEIMNPSNTGRVVSVDIEMNGV